MTTTAWTTRSKAGCCLWAGMVSLRFELHSKELYDGHVAWLGLSRTTRSDDENTAFLAFLSLDMGPEKCLRREEGVRQGVGEMKEGFTVRMNASKSHQQPSSGSDQCRRNIVAPDQTGVHERGAVSCGLTASVPQAAAAWG